MEGKRQPAVAGSGAWSCRALSRTDEQRSTSETLRRTRCGESAPRPSAAHGSLCSAFIVLEDGLGASLLPLDFWLTCVSHGYLNLTLNCTTGPMLHPLRNGFRENQVQDLDAKLCQPLCELIFTHWKDGDVFSQKKKKNRGCTPHQIFPCT